MTLHQALANRLLEAAPLPQLSVAADHCTYFTLWTATEEEISGAVQCGNSATHYPAIFLKPDGSWSTECGCAEATHGQLCCHAVVLAAAVLHNTPLRATYSYTPAVAA